MDAQTALVRALATRIGVELALVIERARTEAWASATFTGARHSFACTLTGARAASVTNRLADNLDALEFKLPGHLVADIAMIERSDTAGCTTFAIEALTVEDC